jgi:hypothetical protein
MLNEQIEKDLPDTLERVLDHGIVIESPALLSGQGIDLASPNTYFIMTAGGQQA